MTKVILSLTLLIILSSNICFGQDDWKPGCIINNQGDTINGLIENRSTKSNSSSCYFRKIDKEEVQILTPQDIAGYRFVDGKYFISKSIDGLEFDQPVFLEFLIRGKVNVYHFKDDYNRYFVEKDAKIYELKNTVRLDTIDNVRYEREKKEYKGILAFILQDAKFQSEIKDCEFSTESLIKIAKKYHEKVCTTEKCIVYEKNVEPIHINWGFNTGLSLNTINFGSNINSNYGLGNLLGCRIEFEKVIDWEERLSFVLDLTIQRFNNYKLKAIDNRYTYVSYNNVEYILSKSNSYSSSIKELAVNLNTTAIKIPITINYTYSKSNIRPYLGAGFVNMFILSQTKDFINPRFQSKFNQSIPTYHLGLEGKFGCKYMFTNNQSIYLELSYEYTKTLNINQELRFTNNLSSVIVGYAF